MAWLKWTTGKSSTTPGRRGVLKVGPGSIAIDLDCCCGCCQCSLLDQAALLNLNMRVTVSGPITGDCRMDFFGAGEHGLLCPHWLWDRSGAAFCQTELAGCQSAYNLDKMWFICPKGANGSHSYQFEASLSNLGCNFATGNRAPLLATTAWTPYIFNCPDTGNYEDFYARFQFPLVATAPGGCACGADDIVFEIEID